ncbi:polyprenyl glycosylphosphotransferase [Mycolicibacterium anyangense]|uniref:Polyprenyl glycosylphosphotransferase n=1 Tax=Mycolicibacterium anyangense TaxID=1431246 RepID=A0A6N4WBL9_9MYCO|nr:polyprenyl glycosylphosphotransferase [Mycolicibacterium anyangense]
MLALTSEIVSSPNSKRVLLPAKVRRSYKSVHDFGDDSLPLTSGIIRSDREIWHRSYARKLLLSDCLIICFAVAAGQLRFAGQPPDLGFPWPGSPLVGYTAVSAAVALLWMVFLSLVGSRSARVVGHGSEEYAIIALATFQLFGLIAIISMLAHIELSRGYLAIALPLGVIGLMFNRRYWRRKTSRRRVRGEDLTSVLVVGTPRVAADIAITFDKDPEAGYQVVGICTPDGPVEGAEVVTVGGTAIPIVGMDEAVVDAVRRTGVGTVALAATEHLRPTEIRRLIWELDSLGVDLIVAPGLVDVAEQRLRSRPVAGMAMLEVTKPQYNRANSQAKRAFDIAFSSVVLLLMSPVFLAAAAAVKLSSPGPIFYVSERIGLNGTTFRMFKFRSMFDGSDTRAAAMIAATESSPLFWKVKDDPRVTPVGRFLRKFSIDELPQFLNVLRGEMSVVGPRPQVRREVDSYDDLVRRRLAVKPGLTGLWQVSGRSNLQIEDAVRLDLTYVENWSLWQDLVIIAKTLRAVLHSEGAY